MPGLDKEVKNQFIIKYLMYTHEINFMYKGMQMFQKLDVPCGTS